MRIISKIELDQVSGGGSTVNVTGHNIGGSNNALGTDFSAYTAENTSVEASSGGRAVSQAAKIAIEALACKAAVDKGKKTPTLGNAAAAAAACTTAAQDVIRGLDTFGRNNPDFVKVMTVKPVP